MPLAADSDTVNVRSACPLSPSAALGLSIFTVGGSSSSVIVPVPVVFAASSVALLGLLRVSFTVSSGSSVTSPFTFTVTVVLRDPAAIVAVPAASAA